MSAIAVLKRGRRAAERLMTDACKVERVSGVDTDPLTGVDVPEYDTVYEGKCKVQSWEGYEQNPRQGGHVFTVQRMSVHLPVGSYRIQTGDIVTVTGSATDDMLVGRVFRMTQEAPFKSYATAYRVFVDYVSD